MAGDLSSFDKHKVVGSAAQKCPLVWIEIELVDEEDQPVPGEKYRIELPDGKVVEGALDSNGFARRERIVPGICKVTFPNLDIDAWERI